MQIIPFLQSVIIMYLSNELCISVGSHISKEAGEEGTVHSCERPEWRTMDTGTSVIIMYLLGLRMHMMPHAVPVRMCACG